MAEAQELKVQSAEHAAAAAAAAEDEERKAYKCQYCDRMFASSQALGGHQNGHRRERDAAKRAEHEAELYAAHGAMPPLPPMYPAPPYPHPPQQQLFMHHAAATAARNAGQFRPWPPLPGPPQHYHPYQAPHDHHFIRVNRELPPLRVDPRYGMVRHHFMASSSHGGRAHAARVEEEQWRSVYYHRNYTGFARMTTARAELAAQAAMEGPSWAPSNMNLGFKQDQARAEGAEGKHAVTKEIDLTLRL